MTGNEQNEMRNDNNADPSSDEILGSRSKSGSCSPLFFFKVSLSSLFFHLLDLPDLSIYYGVYNVSITDGHDGQNYCMKIICGSCWKR